MEGAAGEEKSGRLVIQKEELCGTIPRSASDRFHVTLGLETPSPGKDSSGATLHVERREIERKMREKKGGWGGATLSDTATVHCNYFVIL